VCVLAKKKWLLLAEGEMEKEGATITGVAVG
jgi:hypothetical protein